MGLCMGVTMSVHTVAAQHAAKLALVQVHHFIIDQSVEENVRRLNQERAAQLPQGADTSSAVPRTEIQSLSLRCALVTFPALPSNAMMLNLTSPPWGYRPVIHLCAHVQYRFLALSDASDA